MACAGVLVVCLCLCLTISPPLRPHPSLPPCTAAAAASGKQPPSIHRSPPPRLVRHACCRLPACRIFTNDLRMAIIAAVVAAAACTPRSSTDAACPHYYRCRRSCRRRLTCRDNRCSRRLSCVLSSSLVTPLLSLPLLPSSPPLLPR